jgi:hypothetical protein
MDANLWKSCWVRADGLWSARLLSRSALLLLLLLVGMTCGKKSTSPSDGGNIPRFVRTDYIELDKIARISKFRSTEGHDYPDDYESCRSMKHYYCPKGGDPAPFHQPSWRDILIFAPVTGTVSDLRVEWAGTQVWIASRDYPKLWFGIFHITLRTPLQVGDSVTEGSVLGNHGSDETMSDIAVALCDNNKRRLYSLFDFMTDSLFATYQARGIATRDDLIISKAARDADSVTCSGMYFSGGTIPNWVPLN